MKARISTWTSSWGNNFSLKLTSLAVAFVFWFVMLGRQDITLSRELEVQVMLDPKHIIANQVPKTVTVEIVGPRISLKRFSSKKEVYTLNLANLDTGYHQVTLTKEGLNLPIGLELLAIRPRIVEAFVKKAKPNDLNSETSKEEGGSI